MTLKIHSMYIVDFNSRFVVVFFWNCEKLQRKCVEKTFSHCRWDVSDFRPSEKLFLPRTGRRKLLLSNTLAQSEYQPLTLAQSEYIQPLQVFALWNLSNKSIKEPYPREQHHLLVLNCFDAILMHFPTSVKPDAGTRTIWQCWLN